ncbi:MAG: polysaccharide deacetylase family protein [Armatimonadetes bacterium]|nr:polysaccharide deacetylase family protein [Armatimonadota bacterium]
MADLMSAQNVLIDGGISVQDFPLPVVANPGLSMFDHAKSTVITRRASSVSDNRAYYETAVLTYNLQSRGDRSFQFPDPSRQIVLWVHVDGPSAIGTGSAPFNGAETRPSLIDIQLVTASGQTITSKQRAQCARGWNELKFVLDSSIPPHKVTDQGAPIKRFQQFSPTDANGSVTKIKIRVFGTNDCAQSYMAHEVALNSCTLEPVATKIPVIMYYDDCWSGFVTYAQQTLLDHGGTATLCAIGNFYNATVQSHMTGQQINDAFALGFDIVNHSMTHSPLHNAGAPRNYHSAGALVGVYDDIAQCQALLRDHGLVRDDSDRFLVYPGGINDAQVYTAMDELGIVFGRVANCEPDPNGVSDFLRNPNAGQVYDMCSAEHGVNAYIPIQALQQFEDWIDEGVEEGKPRFIMWHDVFDDSNGTTNHSPNAYNTPQFHADALQYLFDLKDQGKIEFLTLPQWYKRLDSLHRVRGVEY